MKKSLLLIAMFALLITSCTVEKRHYTDGYHVEWHNKAGKNKKVDYKEESTATATQQTNQQQEAVAVVTEQSAPAQQVENVPVVSSEKLNVEKESISREEKQALRQSIREHKAMARSISRETRNDSEVLGATNFSNSQISEASEPDKVLLIILAILIPPLALYLYEGEWTNRVLLNLILSILCWIPGLIHALVIIIGDK
jgi:uncharacterized membrane protein YqaE (UPF0057 family)